MGNNYLISHLDNLQSMDTTFNVKMLQHFGHFHQKAPISCMFAHELMRVKPGDKMRLQTAEFSFKL